MVTSSCGVIEAAAAQTPSLELFDKTKIWYHNSVVA